MIKQIYNKIREKIKMIEKQKKTFEETQIGDMLWCTMPLPKKELKKIEEHHRIRPYLVVQKELNFLLCYQSSSKNKEQANNYEKYCINSKKYQNNKNSWIDLTSVKKIPITKINLKYIQLNQIDIKNMEKRICIAQNNGNAEIIRFNEPIYIEIGDVIRKEQKTYYVYSEDNVNIYCFRIQKKIRKNEKMEAIKINKKTYYTNFKELKTIKRRDNFEIVNIAFKEEILEILEKKHTLKAETYTKVEENFKRNKNKFEIGSVFQYGNSKVMYLYTNKGKYYGVDLLWYLLKTRIFEIKAIEKRKLLGTKDLGEINKVLEILLEKNVQNKEIKKIYKYIRDLLFASTA